MSAQDFDEWVLGKRHKFGLELDADKQRLQHELDSTLRQRRSATPPIRLVPPSLPRAVSSACAECVGLVGLQAKVYDGDVYDGEGLRDAVADAPVRRVGGAPSALPAQEKGEPQTPRCWSALGLAQRKLWR